MPPLFLATFIVAWFIPPTIHAAIICIKNIDGDVFIKLSVKKGKIVDFRVSSQLQFYIRTYFTLKL
jgi:hypothetical protein